MVQLSTRQQYEGSSNLGALCEAFQDDHKNIIQVSSTEILRLGSALLSKRFAIFTGLSGSGKTQLAQAFARWITLATVPADPFVPGTRIEAERAVYHVRAADTLAVEFWNSNDAGNTTKVTLPREMINEWAAYIQAHGISKSTPARKIREVVKTTSRFSDQLHSFESPLRAAAFAQIAANTARALSPIRCYAVIPVGADWTGNENILGYPNGLDQESYLTKPALELILQAKEHPDIPHFLILDEMNLSHVERYFADLLSAIESGEPIPLHEDVVRTAGDRKIPSKLVLPANLFILGTVNVDETTYMFSPKVLDRANVIEFRMDASALESFLQNPARPDLAETDGKGAGFGQAFVTAVRNPAPIPTEVSEQFEREMMLFFRAMQPYGAEFGYRVAHEASRFIHFHKVLSNLPDNDTAWFPVAFDCVVVQKLLPKLHGSRNRLGPLLKMLWFLCLNEDRGADPLQAAEAAARSTDKRMEPTTVPETLADARYSLSSEKIARMWRLLNENGFASFAEA